MVVMMMEKLTVIVKGAEDCDDGEVDGVIQR